LNKIIIVLGLGLLFVLRKDLAPGLINSVSKTKNRLQQVTSTIKEEWEDIVAEAHYTHIKEKIDRDLQRDGLEEAKKDE